MKTNIDYYLEQIENLANEKGFNVYLSKDYANCGWLVFRNETTAKKLYFHFDTTFGNVRNGNGNIYKGVIFDYANEKQEEKMYNFIMEFLEN